MTIPSSISRKIDDLFTLASDHEGNLLSSSARISAAVVFKNKIISYGFNQSKTHPIQKKFGKNPYAICLHAEVDAIIKASKRLSNNLSDCILLIARSRKLNGINQYGLALPCEGCFKCIEAYSIKKIYFTTNNQTIRCIQ